ncbi:MAG: mechanosensitive ion channel family protein [Bryobacterales bacterium]|nr:mechanosensitive ion channel family protein [Bryobacterales bacterium]MBV9398332.1 mechanosensitive ion channel family protein [Bryobacterales bacterium]
MQISVDALGNLRRAEVWMPWIGRGVKVAVIFVVALLVTRLNKRAFRQLRVYATGIINRRGDASRGELEKRARTVSSAMRKLLNTFIWIIAVVMALTELNFHVEPLLAGLGVAGLAAGLGAQTLIKDWLGGLFLLLEDQIRIGDGVTINGIGGTVVEINMRTTVLRAENGAVHIISNGSITTLANLTREYSYYIFETIVAHHADAVKALDILRQTAAEIANEDPFRLSILAPLEVMGVDRLGDKGATLRARFKTLPSEQWRVGRELNLRVKQRFDAAEISFPPVGSGPARD